MYEHPLHFYSYGVMVSYFLSRSLSVRPVAGALLFAVCVCVCVGGVWGVGCCVVLWSVCLFVCLFVCHKLSW